MFQLETLQNCVNVSAANIRKQTIDFLSFVYGFWLQNYMYALVAKQCSSSLEWYQASLDYQLIFCVYSMLGEISLDFFQTIHIQIA
jgi:hypothetical protein